MHLGRTYRDYACNRGDAGYVEYFDEIGVRTIYQHDLGKIMYMKPYRRLAGKRHVSSKPDDHGRTKMLHTQEVCNIASVLARAFGLNEDLTRAIATAHDVGQPPFGSSGSRALKAICVDKKLSFVFDHAHFGAEEIERLSRVKRGAGDHRFEKLADHNLYMSYEEEGESWVQTISNEVLDGVRQHTPQDGRYSNLPGTLEGQVVRLADNLSYITQEVQEAFDLDPSFSGVCEDLRNQGSWEAGNRSPGCGKDAKKKMTKRQLEDDPLGNDVRGKILDLFHERQGLRINVMVERLYIYNHMREAHQLDGGPKMGRSELIKKEVPILEYDPLLDFFVDFQWNKVIAKHVWHNSATEARDKAAEENIRKLYDYLMAVDPKDKKWFQNYVDREKSGGTDAERVSIAAIKCIASMTDSYVETCLDDFKKCPRKGAGDVDMDPTAS
jgi:dGTP triphosphohydrolase